MQPCLAHQQGARLAEALRRFRDERPFVIGIPRGGVLVAEAVARALAAPLDVLAVGKVAGPHRLPLAAVVEDGTHVVDDAARASAGFSTPTLARLIEVERARVERVAARIRGAWPSPPLAGRTVIVIDDAVLSGLTMRASVAAVRARGARRVVVATPLCSFSAAEVLTGDAHEVVWLEALSLADGIRRHGDERVKPCPPIGDEEIHQLIARELQDIGADPFHGATLDGV